MARVEKDHQILVLRPDLSESARVRTFLKTLASRLGFSSERTFDIQVAVGEAVANAVEHAHGVGEVAVEAVVLPDRLEVSIQGRGEFHLPTQEAGREHRGLGLPLMATLSDHLALYSRTEGGTLVSLTFYRPGMRGFDSSLPPSLLEQFAQNSLLDEVLANISDAFAIYDANWRAVYLNVHAGERLGRPREELLGAVIWELLPELNDLFCHEQWHRAAREQRVVTCEEFEPKGQRWYEDRAFPFAGGLAVFSRDITKRKRAEEALRTSEQQLRVAAQAGEIGMWSWVPATNQVSVTANWRALFAVPMDEEVTFDTWTSRLHPMDRETVITELKQAAKERREFHAEYRVVWPDGTTRWLVDRGGALYVDDRLIQMAGVNIDITPQKLVEQELRKSRESARRRLDNILLPEGDLGLLELGDIIDSPAIQSLMNHFYELTGVPMSVMDLNGRLLVGVGWQDICTRFHRVHPETCAHCHESDTKLAAGLSLGESRLYRCKNNMWDIATPIVLAGRHVGNVFSGQFFFEDEEIDYEFFRGQARRYGFDEEEYLRALDAAPRLGRQTVQTAVDFLVELATMLSQLGLSNVRLARAERRAEGLVADMTRASEDLALANEQLRARNEELAQLYQRSFSLAETLQEALVFLPGAVPGVRFGHAYRSATQAARLGGDFLDVFALPGGEVGVIVGDVSGKGLEAAHLASFTRETIRAYALLHRSPQNILRLANQALIHRHGQKNFVTVALMLLDPQTGRARYSLAGHPPPIRVSASRARICRWRTCPPLGAYDDARFVAGQFKLDEESTLVFYTDGITEARGNGKQLGEDGLIALLTRVADEVPEVIAERVLEEVTAYAEGTLRDDAALLAIRRWGKG